VAVKRGATATFRFRITDPGVPAAQAKIQLLDAKRRVKATLAAGWRTPGETVVFTGKVKLPPGRYTWRAACLDYTGETQVRASTNTLVVR
jgi:hypothetical protein